MSADRVSDVLAPASRVPPSVPAPPPTKADVVARAGRAQFGQMAENPRALAALAAVALHYENLDPLLGDLRVMGNSIYITAQAWMKEMHATIPLSCRRWVKRLMNDDECRTLGFQPWRAVPLEERGGGYVGRGSRVWSVQLWLRPWTRLPDGTVSIAADRDWFMASDAIGEANDLNCELTVSAGGAKLKGDPRVLDRQAIKRAEHEVLRDVVSFRLRGVARDEQVSLMQQGLSVAAEDPLDGPADAGPAEPAQRPSAAELMQTALDAGIPPRLAPDVVDAALEQPFPGAYIAREAERLQRERVEPRAAPAVEPGRPAPARRRPPSRPSAAPAAAPAAPAAEPAAEPPAGDTTAPPEAF